MVVGVLLVEFFFPENGSLKGKRHYVRSIKDKLRSNFNVSVSEVEYQDLWQRSTIAIAVVGSDGKFINDNLSKIANFVEKNWAEYIVGFRREIY